MLERMRTEFNTKSTYKGDALDLKKFKYFKDNTLRVKFQKF